MAKTETEKPTEMEQLPMSFDVPAMNFKVLQDTEHNPEDILGSYDPAFIEAIRKLQGIKDVPELKKAGNWGFKCIKPLPKNNDGHSPWKYWSVEYRIMQDKLMPFTEHDEDMLRKAKAVVDGCTSHDQLKAWGARWYKEVDLVEDAGMSPRGVDKLWREVYQPAKRRWETLENGADIKIEF